ncbi:hypothetical protein HK103_001925 [Boothiomyces macroporosus]|uniref:Uncharacterized protein n=1 Tax=Boothiomyces macroporosus TaxID=261099 RepID=A0AAD5UMP0_9FUNG|nr:hypothetical protein HK103_001925 [Boothiomyces macroporosus]
MENSTENASPSIRKHGKRRDGSISNLSIRSAGSTNDLKTGSMSNIRGSKYGSRGSLDQLKDERSSTAGRRFGSMSSVNAAQIDPERRAMDKTTKSMESELEQAQSNLWKSNQSFFSVQKSLYGSSAVLNKLSVLQSIRKPITDSIEEEAEGDVIIFPGEKSARPKSSASTSLPKIADANPTEKPKHYGAGGIAPGLSASESDYMKMVDVTSRLTDPNNYPAAHKAKMEAIKRQQEARSIYGSSVNLSGSVASLSKQASNLSVNKLGKSYASLSSLNGPDSEVYKRLYEDAKHKHEKSSNEDVKFTGDFSLNAGYTNGFKPLPEVEKEKLRANAASSMKNKSTPLLMATSNKKEKVLLPLRDTSNYEHASVGLQQMRRISSINELNDTMSKSKEALNTKALSGNNYGSTQMLNKRGSVPSLLDDIKEDKKNTKAGREMDMLLSSTHNILELGANSPLNNRMPSKEKTNTMNELGKGKARLPLNDAEIKSPKERSQLPDNGGSKGSLLSSRSKLDDTSRNTDLTKINDRRKSAGNLMKLDQVDAKVHTKRKSVGNLLADTEKVNLKNSTDLKTLSTELKPDRPDSAQLSAMPVSEINIEICGQKSKREPWWSTPAIFDDIQPVEPQAGDCHEPKTRKVPNYK